MSKLKNDTTWKKVRAYVLKRDNRTCHYCLSDQANTVDHIVPRSKGGTDDLDNLVAACAKCNYSKQGKDAGVFLQSRSTAPNPTRNLSLTTVLRHSGPFAPPR